MEYTNKNFNINYPIFFLPIYNFWKPIKIPDELIWLNECNIQYPTLYDKFKYYWKSIFDNTNNKLKYLKFKSNTTTLIHRGAVLISIIQSNDEIDISYRSLTEKEVDKEIITIFQLADKYLCENGLLLSVSQAPYKKFMSEYFTIRDKILRLNDRDNIIYDRIEIIEKTLHIINSIEILTEFVKENINRNDDLPFKIFLLSINFLIFIGEFLWNYEL